MKYSLAISDFLEEISSLSYSIIFPLFLCSDCCGRLSYLSLLFFGTLHSNGHIFPFLLCFLLLFFSQLFVRLPQTAIFTLNLLNQPSQMGSPNLNFSFLRTIGLENMQLYLVRGKRWDDKETVWCMLFSTGREGESIILLPFFFHLVREEKLYIKKVGGVEERSKKEGIYVNV